MQLFSATDNLVLRAQPVPSGGAPKGKLRHVAFEPGYQFWTEDQPVPYAAFPLRGVISLQASPQEKKRVEVAEVGREGFIGICLLFGSLKSYTTAVAVTPGEALLVPPDLFRRYLQRPAFRAAAERYANFLFLMLERIATCNRAHGIEAVCVERLLLMHDRTDAQCFSITQEDFARQIGVRRASVSRGVSRLKKAGAIAYDRRGRVSILDRGHLERFACSCYWTIKAEFDLLMKPVR